MWCYCFVCHVLFRLAVIRTRTWLFSLWTLSGSCLWSSWRRGSSPTSDSRKTSSDLLSTSWKRIGKETSGLLICCVAPRIHLQSCSLPHLLFPLCLSLFFSLPWVNMLFARARRWIHAKSVLSLAMSESALNGLQAAVIKEFGFWEGKLL